MTVLHLYQKYELLEKFKRKLIDKKLINNETEIKTEICYNIEINQLNIDHNELTNIIKLLINSDKFDEIYFESVKNKQSFSFSVEFGPRLNFCTPFSTNVLCILKNIGIDSVTRFEISHLYHFPANNAEYFKSKESEICNELHDKMTEMMYNKPIESFDIVAPPDQVYFVKILENGRKALEDVNKSMGLAMDEWDLSYYHDVFVNVIGRNPTNVECFDLAQSNSEHSRHWFFKGQMIIDDVVMEKSLLDLIINTQKFSNQNNVIAFSDNSSAIKGFSTHVLTLSNPSIPSMYKIVENLQHICFTAETHNFPTGVAPFPGAATGTGGRIRDVQAVGTGGIVVAGSAGYCFGNLYLDDYQLPWEIKPGFKYPANFASSVEIAIEASNGASDYGNKFGEPVITGFCRSFGMKTENGEWREWIKPIMFSGGIGQLSNWHVDKTEPTVDQLVVKIGGPVYRIGVGGGAASSVEVQGDNSRDNELDIGAVQRGDAQMENKLNRVIRGCIDLRQFNPIKSIHDQGAGGNGNVLKELVNPQGAIIDPSSFQLGDKTINILELWGAEYQESNGLLLNSEDLEHFTRLCHRERCPLSVVGKITGDGKIRLKNWSSKVKDVNSLEYPEELDLAVVLGKMPQKNFTMKRTQTWLHVLSLPENLKVEEALTRVLRLPSVGSKRFLTNKVDRSVSGLIAQQQCVGPLHTPLSDVAVVALSYWDTVGAATSIGEQPIKMLLSAKSGARMSLMEALTNLAMAPVSCLEDIKISGNWMWPAKLFGEGSKLWDACEAFCDLLKHLNIAVDGGKDSLSMAATVNDRDVIKSPGSLVVSAYVGCPDVRLVVTPDLKGNGTLLWIKLSKLCRLGGSALGQVFSQLGESCPDFEDIALFKETWKCLQRFIFDSKIQAAHDISDGGLLTCILEMAFAGNVGCFINIISNSQPESSEKISGPIPILFNEELGWVIEVAEDDLVSVITGLDESNLLYGIIGQSSRPYCKAPQISLYVNEERIFDEVNLGELRAIWEDTSYHLEKLQCNARCVEEEYKLYRDPCITECPFVVNEESISPCTKISLNRIKVAILREEGSNGDKEMAASFIRAGFEAWDVAMEDLLSDKITLDRFGGVAFVGGFSFGDVLGSAKGWAASIKSNERIKSQFDYFRKREDTFSLGVCNGCQLMARIGWLNGDNEDAETSTICFGENESNRFESRFTTVQIPNDTKSIMLSKMRGNRLGVWVAHGEGRLTVEEKDSSEIQSNGQVAMKYVSSDQRSTSSVSYPFNPNGSMFDIAGLCSKDGRHLALMPHPERSILWWQWPYTGNLKKVTDVSPWLSMFSSALQWAEQFSD